MANATIPSLPQAIALTGAEQMEAVQAGTSVRVTAAMLAGIGAPGPPGPQGAPGPQGPQGPSGASDLPVSPEVGSFASLPPASSFPGFIASTIDQGVVYSNGTSWIILEAQTTPGVLQGLFTFNTLPAAAATLNSIALTSDVGPVYSNGVTWLVLYNPTTATLGISSSTPLIAGVNGTAYSLQLTSTQGTAPITWILVSQFGAANAWQVSPSGLLTCTSPATTSAPDNLMVQATDATGAAIQKLLTVVIAASSLTPAATPTFSPAAGTYTGTQTVAMASTTSGATIFYTINGSTPTTSSPVYSTPISVAMSQTVQAIATASGFSQSAVGSASYVITSAGFRYKFNPLDAAMSIAYQQNTPSAQWTSDINALKAHPVPGGNGAQMYVAGWRWPALETGANNNLMSDAVNGTGQFAGFQLILAAYTYLQSQIPGAHFGLSIMGVNAGNNYTAAVITTRNWGTTGLIVPGNIATCGGSLTVANSFGSSSTTTYPVAPIYTGSSFYGFGFTGWTGTVLTEGVYAFWNPGVNQRYINFWQALSLFQYVAPTGHPLAGTTLTFDTDPLFEYIFSNDEYSYAMLSGQNPTDGGGVTVNPPLSPGPATLPSNTKAIAAYKLWATKGTGFFPHTLVGANMTYGFQAAHGNDTYPLVAGYVNQNIAPSTGALSTIVGLALTGSDTYGRDFVQAPTQANPAKQGFIGVSNPPMPTGMGAVTNVSLAGFMPKVAQIQPIDYGTLLPSGTANNSAAAVVSLANAANNSFYQSTLRIWCMGDGSTFSNTAWTTYVQPQLVAGVTPFSTVRPSNLP